MNKNILISLVFIIFLTFSANAQTSLNGKWKLIAIKEGIPLARLVTLNINGKKIGGNGGCNAFGGNFKRTGKKVKFTQIISTKMWCDYGELETEYFETLGKAVFYQFKGEQLYLLNDKRETILRFKKA